MSQPPAVALREALIHALAEHGAIQSASVMAAMRTVPRHLFAPWLSLEEAYSDRAWVLPEMIAETMSTISQPTAVAMMLEGFALAEGQRVLEIGTGTGYNAALMAYIVGESGQIITVDIEQPLVEAARIRLVDHSNVKVIHGDGGQGFSAGAPYDRIVATVGVWDLPPTWLEQLKPDGQLVVPLHLGGEPEDHILIAFRHDGSVLVGHAITPVGMVLMRGEYAGHGRAVPNQNGQDWRGVSSDNLMVRAYSHSLNYQLQSGEKIIDKPSVRLVLSKRDEKLP